MSSPSERAQDVDRLVGILRDHQGFERQVYPVTSNWASKLGHVCERHLYYMRNDWDKAEQRDWKGVGLRGNLIADWWKRYMMGKGFNCIHDQMPLSKELREKYQISGKIDGRIGWAGIAPVLYEFKTMMEYTFKTVNSYLDIVNSRVPYIRMYAAQIQVYLYDNNEEAGLFILCNPITLEWKAIPVLLDRAYCEWLLAKAERINAAFGDKNAPDRIPYEAGICGKCQFAHICLPGKQNAGVKLMSSSRLKEVLDTIKETDEAAKRNKKLREEARALAISIGEDFIVDTSYKVEVNKTGEKVRVNFVSLE